MDIDVGLSTVRIIIWICSNAGKILVEVTNINRLVVDIEWTGCLVRAPGFIDQFPKYEYALEVGARFDARLRLVVMNKICRLLVIVISEKCVLQVVFSINGTRLVCIQTNFRNLHKVQIIVKNLVKLYCAALYFYCYSGLYCIALRCVVLLIACKPCLVRLNEPYYAPWIVLRYLSMQILIGARSVKTGTTRTVAIHPGSLSSTARYDVPSRPTENGWVTSLRANQCWLVGSDWYRTVA